MGECEKVGKMRFYPKPDARPNYRADLSTEPIVSESSPISSQAIVPAAPRHAPPRGPRRSGPARPGGTPRAAACAVAFAHRRGGSGTAAGAWRAPDLDRSAS